MEKYISQVKIKGYRGFGEEVISDFAIPNGQLGSGLTFLVGSNNSGKSSIIECLKYFRGVRRGDSISEDKRNSKNNNRVELTLILKNDEKIIIETDKRGGALLNLREGKHYNKFYFIPSRRYFDQNLGFSENNKERYQSSLSHLRNQSAGALGGRLLDIYNNSEHYEEFNKMLYTILNQEIQWAIDVNSAGQQYLKWTTGNLYHSSEGLGDGIISLFYIAEALLNDKDVSTIVVDEPELSLHPSVQKRIMKLFMEHSKTKQIIISTHSPYFFNFNALINGAIVQRVYKKDGTIKISKLSEKTVKDISSSLNNINNPHVFGLKAMETFFIEEGVIVVEGPEDVVLYPKIASQLSSEFKGEFFGWGAGGADCIEKICYILKDLGFSKVVGILDGNKNDKCKELQSKFSDFRFFDIPADDIRDKKPIKAKNAVKGLMKNGNLKDEHKEEMLKIITSINQYLN